MKIELHEYDIDAIREVETLHWLIKTPIRILIISSCILFLLNIPILFAANNISSIIIRAVWLFGNIILVLLEYPDLGGSYTCDPNGLSFWILFRLQSRKVKEAYQYARFILYEDKTIIKQREKKHADLLFMYLAIGHRKFINKPFAELEWNPCNVIYTREQTIEIEKEYKRRKDAREARRLREEKEFGWLNEDKK